MTDVQQIPLSTITGEASSLADHAGQVLLVVNVASKCGLTPQYEGLEKIYSERKDQGFSVLGFPANNFGSQEPGTDAEIAEFAVAHAAEFGDGLTILAPVVERTRNVHDVPLLVLPSGPCRRLQSDDRNIGRAAQDL